MQELYVAGIIRDSPEVTNAISLLRERTRSTWSIS
jgi:hypothetical protein